MVKLLEGAQCPLKNGEYVVKHQTHKLPNVSIPSFIKNVSKNLSIKVAKIDLRLCFRIFLNPPPPPPHKKKKKKKENRLLIEVY